MPNNENLHFLGELGQGRNALLGGRHPRPVNPLPRVLIEVEQAVEHAQKGKGKVGRGNMKVSDLFPISRPDRRDGANRFLPPAEFPYNNRVGIEIEVEGINGNAGYDDHGDYTPQWEEIRRGWLSKEDGSLRNGGIEYITLIGIRAGEALAHLKGLDKFIQEQRNSKFSFRCGLHIHLDVSEHTLEELYKVCVVYSVLEDLLFLVSGGRRENKFCVAVLDSYTIVPKVIHYGHEKKWDHLEATLAEGTKYMAMNLLPIRQFGSIEFRHHYGTSDPDQIRRWMTILSDVVEGSRSLKVEELEAALIEVNTTSEYEKLVKYLLPHSYKEFTGDLKDHLYQGVAFVKQSFLQESIEVQTEIQLPGRRL
jgi:hypothetical protein